MLVAAVATHAAASGGPGSSIQSSLSFESPSERLVTQLSRPDAAGPCRLKMWFGSFGGVVLFHIAFAITQAWTSIPCACAVLIRDCSGSNPGAIDSFTGSPDRRQKQSPRRTTWATIAFACDAFVAATSASICGWSLMPSPKASAQYARNWPTVAAAPCGDTSDGKGANKLATYQRTAASVVSFRLFPSSTRVTVR